MHVCIRVNVQNQQQPSIYHQREGKKENADSLNEQKNNRGPREKKPSVQQNLISYTSVVQLEGRQGAEYVVPAFTIVFFLWYLTFILNTPWLRLG